MKIKMEIKYELKTLLEQHLFVVKGDEDTIRKHFTIQYPNNDIAVLEHLSNMGTFEVHILPKESE